MIFIIIILDFIIFSLLAIKSSDSIEENDFVSMSSPSTFNFKVTKAKRPIEENSFNEVALDEFFKKAKQPRKIPTVLERDPINLLFESYAARMKQLPKEIQSYVNLQMSQIFFNAENPQMQIPIAQLPQP